MRTISQLLLTFLLNACWQIALIATVAALCARLLRGTTVRHQNLLWVTALAFSFGLPVLTCAPLLGGPLFSEPPRAIVQPVRGEFIPAPQLMLGAQEPSPMAPNEAPPYIGR